MDLFQESAFFVGDATQVPSPLHVGANISSSGDQNTCMLHIHVRRFREQTTAVLSYTSWETSCAHTGPHPTRHTAPQPTRNSACIEVATAVNVYNITISITFSGSSVATSISPVHPNDLHIVYFEVINLSPCTITYTLLPLKWSHVRSCKKNQQAYLSPRVQVRAIDSGDCLPIGFVWTIDFGGYLLIGIVRTFDTGDCQIIGIVQTIDVGDRLLRARIKEDIVL